MASISLLIGSDVHHFVFTDISSFAFIKYFFLYFDIIAFQQTLKIGTTIASYLSGKT